MRITPSVRIPLTLYTDTMTLSSTFWYERKLRVSTFLRHFCFLPPACMTHRRFRPMEFDTLPPMGEFYRPRAIEHFTTRSTYKAVKYSDFHTVCTLRKHFILDCYQLQDSILKTKLLNIGVFHF